MANRPYRRLLVAASVLTLAAVVSACGGGGRPTSESSPQQPAATAPPAAPSPQAEPGPAPEQAAGGAAGAEGTVVVVATDEAGRFRFEPDRIEVRPGQQVTLRVVNRGPSPHDLSIERLQVDTGQFNPGEERTLTFAAPTQPGEYEFICTVPGHLQLGMKGTLVVR